MHGFKNDKKTGPEGFVEGKIFRWKSSKAVISIKQFFCNCLITHHDVAMFCDVKSKAVISKATQNPDPGTRNQPNFFFRFPHPQNMGEKPEEWWELGLNSRTGTDADVSRGA